jgi:transcriptional regulator with XRE-family HTH domain
MALTRSNATPCKGDALPVSPREATAQRKVGTKSLSEAVGQNARQVRSLHNLSQDDVAERMRALGHAWSRQTTSDVERAVRNVTVNELLGLALVLGTPVGELLDVRGYLRAVLAAVDPGDPDLPYTEPHSLDDPTAVEIPGTEGIGIPPAVLRALVESRITLRLAWDDGPAAIRIEPVEGHLDDLYQSIAEFRRRATSEES